MACVHKLCAGLESGSSSCSVVTPRLKDEGGDERYSVGSKDILKD